MTSGDCNDLDALSFFSAAVGGIEGLRRVEAQERARVVAAEAQGQREAQAYARAMKRGTRRCNASTKAGERCTRPAVAGTKRCHQHKKAPKFRRTDRDRADMAEGWRKSPSRARKSLVGQ